MKRLWIIGLALVSVLLIAADLKISQLSNNTSPNGGESLPFAQSTTNGRITTANLANWIGRSGFMPTSQVIVQVSVLNVTSNLITTNITVYQTNISNFQITTNLIVYQTNIFNQTFTTNLTVWQTNISNYEIVTNLTVYQTNISSYQITTNLYVYNTNIVNTEIVTNLYSTFNYTSNLYSTNIYVSNLFATNIYVSNIFVTNLYAQYIQYTNNMTAIATNDTVKAVDWSLPFNTYTNATSMETNLVLNPTNMVTGQDMLVVLNAANGNFDVTVTNFTGTAVRWRQGLTNGSTSFTVTNGTRAELYLTPRGLGAGMEVDAIYDWFQ